MNTRNSLVAIAIAMAVCPALQAEESTSVAEAFAAGKTTLDFRLRYENVTQDNALKDADALTLRTMLNYSSGNYQGFSTTVELEDTRIVLGQGDYTVGPTGYNPGEYSVIGDPEHTELDQGYVQYAAKGLTVKAGRQVITMDNHRFVGHVGWRQDKQTFDGVSVKYVPMQEVTLNYAYLTQRNRIFAEAADFDSKDHLLNASYKTPYGTLTGYGYLLEIDNETDNSLDTWGVRFAGATELSGTKVLYEAEFATQSSETATTDFDADYLNLSIGAVVSGITAKLGYESLGSDNGSYGFSTPLATLHKFNGWADMFLSTPASGLVDTSVSVSGSLLEGSWMVVYHAFDADEKTATLDDLGSEVDVQYTKALGKNYSVGLKYAAYSGDSGYVDTDKAWLWFGAKF